MVFDDRVDAGVRTIRNLSYYSLPLSPPTSEPRCSKFEPITTLFAISYVGLRCCISCFYITSHGGKDIHRLLPSSGLCELNITLEVGGLFSSSFHTFPYNINVLHVGQVFLVSLLCVFRGPHLWERLAIFKGWVLSTMVRGSV